MCVCGWGGGGVEAEHLSTLQIQNKLVTGKRYFQRESCLRVHFNVLDLTFRYRIHDNNLILSVYVFCIRSTKITKVLKIIINVSLFSLKKSV